MDARCAPSDIAGHPPDQLTDFEINSRTRPASAFETSRRRRYERPGDATGRPCPPVRKQGHCVSSAKSISAVYLDRSGLLGAAW